MNIGSGNTYPSNALSNFAPHSFVKASGNATFTHSIGRRKPEETVLTINEFVSNLNRLRNKL